MVGFIRFGNDFTQNFYQIEIPLKVTVPSASSTSDCSPLSAQEVASRKRNRFVISIIDSIEIMAMSVDLSTFGIYYKK
jgi:hypothetical protein